MLNFAVLHGSDGNEVQFEDQQAVVKNADCLLVFLMDFELGAIAEVTLDFGLKECKEYRESTKNTDVNYEQELNKFLEAVKGQQGKFYLWSVEYDCCLMFIEEGEKILTYKELCDKLGYEDN